MAVRLVLSYVDAADADSLSRRIFLRSQAERAANIHAGLSADLAHGFSDVVDFLIRRADGRC